MIWKSIFVPSGYENGVLTGELKILRGRSWNSMKTVMSARCSVERTCFRLSEIQVLDRRFRPHRDFHENPILRSAKDLVLAYFAGKEDKDSLHTWTEV